MSIEWWNKERRPLVKLLIDNIFIERLGFIPSYIELQTRARPYVQSNKYTYSCNNNKCSLFTGVWVLHSWPKVKGQRLFYEPSLLSGPSVYVSGVEAWLHSHLTFWFVKWLPIDIKQPAAMLACQRLNQMPPILDFRGREI